MQSSNVAPYAPLPRAARAVPFYPYPVATGGPWAFDFVPSPAALDAALKRALDVLLAAALLTALAPVLAVAILLIRLTSRGDPIFVQPRIGLHGEEFSMLKLRTMVYGADRLEDRLARREAGPFLKIRNDPRVTPVGRVLRRLSIDELPQLVNVLKGDMSLVGPRPLLRCDVAKLASAARKRRFLVKPGITGLWQVSGRSACSGEERVRLDQEYVDRWTPWLDFEILVRTVPAVLSMRGAS